MKKIVFVILTVLALMFSIVTGFIVVPVSANFIPETPPQGIKINGDGSVEGTSMLNRNGNVYTFTGDITETIVVSCDNIVLDGAGFMLQGNGVSTGVFLQDQTDVVIKNLNIQGFKIGIKSTVGDFFWQQNWTYGSNSIINNTIANNNVGVFLSARTSTFVTDNYIKNNTCGITLNSNGILRGNRFSHNQYAISEYGYGANNNIDSSNSVNGKPVYYWVSIHNKTVPSDAGLVTLKNCTRITVQNLQLEGSTNGLFLLYTTGSTIKNNVFVYNSHGITLKSSPNNRIEGNSVLENQQNGIYLYDSSNTTLLNNTIANNVQAGVDVDSSTNLNVTKNTIAGNGGNGIFVDDITNSSFTNNVITQNYGCGLGFGYGPNGIVNSNIISKNNDGIWMSNTHNNTITFNSVADNAGYAIYLEGDQKHNILHHNNFINNKIVNGSQVYIKMIWSYPDLFKRLPSNQTSRPPELVDGAVNTWDDGKQGNYWSDYKIRYPNTSNAETIGNIPYILNSNNQDNHPLLSPVENTNTNLPFNQYPTELFVTPNQLDSPNSTNSNVTSFQLLLITCCSLIAGFLGVTILVYFKHKKP